MKPTFFIFVETKTGEIIKAFTWCRDKESGIQRALRDASEFGHSVVRVWAEPINEEI